LRVSKAKSKADKAKAKSEKSSKSQSEGMPKKFAMEKESKGSPVLNLAVKDVIQLRADIDKLIRSAAEDIAQGLIDAAKTGQVAPAKYLFEAVGLYPATEETLPKPEGESLAERLLKRMGLPTEPVSGGEDREKFGGVT
jgi:hypothetical protein